MLCGVDRVTKYFKSVSTQLEQSQYEKLIDICEREGCKPYAVLKDLLTDYLESYPHEGKKAPQKTLDESGGLNEPKRDESRPDSESP